MSVARKSAGGLVVVAGLAALAASPIGRDLRLGVRSRVAQLTHRHDPVAPFCEAPCYEPVPADGADTLRGQTEALP
jgi:hypothetical protein